ncbi:hypothetical protein [Marisediminitalea sp.]|uniref:hypothetical protein n=1 Tax=Marisediminitalea sp. TaxID=2662268 RepID=UPI003517CE25
MIQLKKIYTDSTYPLHFVYKDRDGVPIDITGATATLVLRKNLHTPPEITKAATIDGPNGLIQFEIEPTDTAGILDEETSGKYLIGAVLDHNGQKLTLLQTTVEVHQNIVSA